MERADTEEFDIISSIRDNAVLSQLPVIVISASTDEAAEIRSLSLGANDFIRRPFNPSLLLHCLRNTINLRETASIVNAIQRDKLTGIFNRETFFDKSSAMIRDRAPGYYVMSCFDIDNFKLINDRYGAAEGDRILQKIAKLAKENITRIGGITGRISADNFAALYPEDRTHDGGDFIVRMRDMELDPEDSRFAATMSEGRYIVGDLTLPASAIYDRAFIAKQSVKGRYDNHVAYFNETMLDRLVREQEITNEMNRALVLRQFEIWFQPQFNHSTGAIIGSEAIVRWRHPEKGLIQPNRFIPVFEQNGFIYELDKYVWEETCRYLRKWTDEGRSPLPVSVNISRYDVFRPDLTDLLTGLMLKYGLPVDLMRLEITESAFAQSTDQIVSVVKDLISCGFTVEIDDFGSGYSSLNTLKDVPAHILKLDMRFLESNDNSQRGGNILESIVRMAKWLNMSVIAEGVETLEQADYLKSIGCSYVQGFLYAKPMSAEDYENLAAGVGKEERLISLRVMDNIDNNAFWNPRSMDTLIFNTYVGSACIFEYHHGRIELLRANDKFIQVTGSTMTVEDALKLNWSEYTDELSVISIGKRLEESAASGEEAAMELLFTRLPGCPAETYLRMNLRVLASSGDRYLVYCTSENITAQKRAEQTEKHVATQLKTIMGNIDNGVVAVSLAGEKPEILFANECFYSMLGYSPDELRTEKINLFDFIHPDDSARVRALIGGCGTTGAPVSVIFRLKQRDGSYMMTENSVSFAELPEFNGYIQLHILRDITVEKVAAHELLDNMPCAAALYESDGDTAVATYLNRRFRDITGTEAPQSGRIPLESLLHADDIPVLNGEIRSAMSAGRDVSCSVRLKNAHGEYSRFRVDGKLVPETGGGCLIYASHTPAPQTVQYFRNMLPVTLSAMMSTSNDLSFVKDINRRFICCSRSLLQLIGVEDEEQVKGKTDYDLLSRDFADRFAAIDDEVIATGKACLDYDELIPSCDNTIKYGNTSKYPLTDADGNVIGLYAITRDVTEYHTAFERLKLVTSSIPGGLVTYNCAPDDIRISYFNDGCCELFGYTRDEYEIKCSGKPFDMVFADDTDMLRSQFRELINNNKPIDCIYRAHINGGGFKWIRHKAAAAVRNGDYVTVNAVLLDVTEEREANERLRISEEEHRLAVEHGGNVVCRFNVAERSLMVTPDIAARLSLPETVTDVPDGPVNKGAVAKESIKAFTDFYTEIIRGNKSGSGAFQIRIAGEWKWLEAKYSTIFSAHGEPISAVVSYYDITERLEKEAVYKKWQQSLGEKPPRSYTLFRCNLNKNAAFDTVEGALLELDGKHGMTALSEWLTEYINVYVHCDDRDCFDALINPDTLLAGYYRGKRSVTLEYREMLTFETHRWLRLSVDLVEYPNSTDIEAYMMFEDINDAKLAELQTRELADTDALTGLLNRGAFITRMTRILNGKTQGSLYALLMFDLDRFKLVNDNFGHAVGDQVLIDVSNTIRGLVRHDDLVCRLGGDEFMVCLRDIANKAAIVKKARQICSALHKSFSVEVQLSVSLGIAVSPEDGPDFETLYHKADIALYHVKANGRDNYAFYNNSMSDDIRSHSNPVETVIPVNAAEDVLKRRMLIVEDNKINRNVLANIFRNKYIVDTADDGNAALTRLRRYGAGISVVLLDLIMPGMDGFAVLEQMRNSPEMQSIPVVVVSGVDEREAGLRTIRCGASDFVTKPIDPDLLMIRVESAVAKAENERLRARNRFLTLRGGEYAKYKAVLENECVAMVEYDRVNEAFIYDTSISLYVAGKFDTRPLWDILIQDNVADSDTVNEMRRLARSAPNDGSRAGGSMSLLMRAPSGEMHCFLFKVVERSDEFQGGDKVILTFTDTGDCG